MTGEESAGRLRLSAVKDERGRFHVDDELGRLLGTDLRTAFGRGSGWRRRVASQVQALPLLFGTE